jgi:hypothetical protein
VFDLVSVAFERLIAQICLTFVIPMALFAVVVLAAHGDPGPGGLIKYGVEDLALRYFQVVAVIAVLLAVFSTFGSSHAALRSAHWIDRAMPFIAYTASGLLAVAGLLKWMA